MDWPHNVRVVAYADDTALLIGGDTRIAIEETAKRCMDMIGGWSEYQQLQFSARKTEALMLRVPHGTNMNTYRNPTVRMGGTAVKFSRKVRYLGVILEKRFMFQAHGREVSQKARAAYSGVARFARADWGVSFRVARLIYEATVVSIVAYAASTFEHRVRLNRKFAVSLRTAQRPALLAMCKAYRTSPTVPLCVIAGVLPLDYVMLVRAAMYRLTHDQTVQRGSHTFQPGTGHAYKERTRQRLRECAYE